MLKKMLIQGLVAAVLIGAAAAVYAQGRDIGYLAAPTERGSLDLEQDRDRDGNRRDHQVREHRERHGDRDQARLERHSRDRGRDHDRDDD